MTAIVTPVTTGTKLGDNTGPGGALVGYTTIMGTDGATPVAPATQGAQASILAAIQALGTQTTAAAVLAKLSADPATAAGVAAVVTAVQALGAVPVASQTTLAAVLAKLSADPSTATGVAAVVTAVQALGNAPVATQTTLAAVLAKLTADPSTATGVAAVVTAIQAHGTVPVATQTTLAAVLAKLSADPATAAGVTALLTGIVLAAGENHVGQVGGHSKVATASIVRPADTTAYTIGDLIAASVTAATVNGAATSLPAARVNAGTGSIRRVRVSRSTVGPGTDVVRVHFFKTAPTVTNGDNGALVVNGVGAVHLGLADVTLDRIFNDGTKGIAAPAVGGEITFDAGAATTAIFFLLEARTAITPGNAETFTVAAEVYQD